uniref:F-box domain-containing protein n=1 Tax=Steinernema glaseri TaxID=37863 RepID=A0A1I7Y380_9BILA
MDDVPFLFVNAVLHCLNSESLSAPRLLAHPLWSSVAEEHHGKRKDYVFSVRHTFGKAFQFYVEKTGEDQYFTPEEWLRSGISYSRIRNIILCSSYQRDLPFRTFEEALNCAHRMVPYLNNLRQITVTMHLDGENRSLDFLWKRPCHTFASFRLPLKVPLPRSRAALYILYDRDVRWNLDNNDQLRTVCTWIHPYNAVRYLLPLCAEKRLTWKFSFTLKASTLNSLKTWQGDAPWDDIYPEVRNSREPPQPEEGRAFFEDEHIQKEFVWRSDRGASLTITWK